MNSMNMRRHTADPPQGKRRSSIKLPFKLCGGPGAACLSGAEGTQELSCVDQFPPAVGAWIYTPTMCSISHGWDDVAGGLAQVTKVDPTECNGGDHWITVAQHNRRMSWKSLRDQQQKLHEYHGNEFARPDPDYNDYGPDDGWR